MAARFDLLIAYGKTLRCCLVTTFLHQNVNGVSILVNHPPKILELAPDLDEHLIEIPGVTQSALSFLKLSRIFWPESVAPLPNGFIRDGNATFGKKVFNIPQAQEKAIVQPNCMTDAGRRKSVSMV